jgi:CDP-diacylglycerol--glycerol-3-phosphate 3-phosphatidyltransferase
MNLANKLSFFRIILAPVFFAVYFSPRFFPVLFITGTYSTNRIIYCTVPILWLIFIVSEITDFFDGFVARKLNITSDFGKLLDPFADTLVQITCFLCFVIDGIFPAFLFLIVIYREFGILFLRNLMLKKGITLGARLGGKIKTVAYIVAAGAALLAVSIERLSILESYLHYFKTGSLIIFVISVFFAVVSFIDYLLIYQKTGTTNE